jgi:hypothetical protein
VDIAGLVGLLTPYLPFLLGLGQKAVEKGAEKLGEEGAIAIWGKLSPKVEGNLSADAARDLAKNPDDKEAAGVLRYQLKKFLEAPENAVIVAEIQKILEEKNVKPGEGGKFNVKVEDSNVGAIGDRNKVQMNIGVDKN